MRSSDLPSSHCANGKEKSGKEIHGDTLTRNGIIEVGEEVVYYCCVVKAVSSGKPNDFDVGNRRSHERK
jgi:hypothetical protein